MAGTGDWLLGGLVAFLVTVATTPAGVSGAVFLLPFQVSVLHVANPALTPTNLLYNVISTRTGVTVMLSSRPRQDAWF